MVDMTPSTGTAAREVDISALPVGAKVGRYEILAVLGHGGYGITYRARDTQLGRDVAIKEYLPTLLAYRDAGSTVLPRSTKVANDFSWGRDRFVTEGRTLATLHEAPGIVKVFDFLEINGTAYIVMELVRGDTLEAFVGKSGPLDAAAVERILWPLLRGLEQVHNAGFLHRDIKPANILIGASGQPTLIDFGASRVAIAGRTTAMTAVFTPGYAAAEQFTSAKEGPWTDIYGLAATLYHAITGGPPPSAFDRMLDDDYTPVGERAATGFPAGLLAGIDAGLAVRASDRPQSVAGWRALLTTGEMSVDQSATAVVPRATELLLRAVGAVRSAAVGPAMAIASSAPTSAGKGPNRTLIYTGVVTAFLALSVGGYFVFAPSKPTTAAAEQQQADAAARHAAEEAQRKAEAEMAAKLKQEEDARAKAAAEAETKRKADEALAKAQAERQKADAEAMAKAEADVKAKADAEAAAKKAAEAAETTLHLALIDRRHVQVALTALGFDTHGSDGTFGPRTREMIVAWQKARTEPPTGFLSGAQNQALLKDAGPAIAKYDAEQKRAEEDKKKVDDEAKAKAAASVSASPAVPAPAATNGFDGKWLMVQVCPPAGKGAGYTNEIKLLVKDSHAKGEAGIGGKPGWLSVDGQIGADGSASLYFKGLTDDPKLSVSGGAPSGEPYDFVIQANFQRNTGAGIRTRYRTCTFKFLRLDDR